MLSYWCVRECKKVMHFASFFQTHQQNWFLLIKRRWSCILSAMFATITHPEETLKKTFTGEKFKYRRRNYSTSPRILVKQSSEWENSLTHLETFRMWVIYQQSTGELNGHQRQKPFETKKKLGVDIGYITSWRSFTRSIVSRGTDISLSMEPQNLWEPWFSGASTALICNYH